MAIQNQMNVVITSPRRMGKTALVDFVFHQGSIEDHYFTINVDILHTTCFKEFIYTLGTAIYDKIASKSDKMRRLFISTLRSLSASFGYDPVQNTPTFDIKLGDITLPVYPEDKQCQLCVCRKPTCDIGGNVSVFTPPLLPKCEVDAVGSHRVANLHIICHRSFQGCQQGHFSRSYREGIHHFPWCNPICPAHLEGCLCADSTRRDLRHVAHRPTD